MKFKNLIDNLIEMESFGSNSKKENKEANGWKTI